VSRSGGRARRRVAGAGACLVPAAWLRRTAISRSTMIMKG